MQAGHKDDRDHRVYERNQELGFQNNPKTIDEFLRKEVNVLEEPAKGTRQEALRETSHLLILNRKEETEHKRQEERNSHITNIRNIFKNN